MKRSFFATCACTALWTVGMAAGPARAAVLFDTLGADSSGYSIIAPGSQGGPLAASFSTGATAASLTDVKLLLTTTNVTSGESVSVALYDDNATSPGNLLQTIGNIAESSLTNPFTVVDLPLGTPYALAANARYWIELAEPDGGAKWSWTSDQSGTGVSGESYLFNGLRTCRSVPELNGR